MDDIEDFVDDILGDLGDKLQKFLEERDQEYKERAKLGVQISEGFMRYEVLIGGHQVFIYHDTSIHRWYFKDEKYYTFFSASEVKGQTIVNFLTELAKVLSPRAAAASDKSFAGAAADLESSGEEIYGGD